MSYKVSVEFVRSCASEIIRQLCIEHSQHCMTQSQIAEELGLTKSQVSRIATGVCTPSSMTLIGLYRMYCSLGMLVKRHDYNLSTVSL